MQDASAKMGTCLFRCPKMNPYGNNSNGWHIPRITSIDGGLYLNDEKYGAKTESEDSQAGVELSVLTVKAWLGLSIINCLGVNMNYWIKIST